MTESNSLVGILTNDISCLNFLSSPCPSEEVCSSIEVHGDYSFIRDPNKLSNDLFEVIGKNYPSLKGIDVVSDKKGLVLRSYTDKNCIEKNEIMTYVMMGIRLYHIYTKIHPEELQDALE